MIEWGVIPTNSEKPVQVLGGCLVLLNGQPPRLFGVYPLPSLYLIVITIISRFAPQRTTFFQLRSVQQFSFWQCSPQKSRTNC
jgi:hypothetical protein